MCVIEKAAWGWVELGSHLGTFEGGDRGCIGAYGVYVEGSGLPGLGFRISGFRALGFMGLGLKV